MAIEIKDVSGATHTISGRGVSGTALGLGIAGTALGVLNSGGLFGIGGASAEPAISKDQFYQTLISQINTQADRDIAIERRFASVESALATSAAVGECNRAAIQREFQVVDTRFDSEARYDDLALRYALCGTIKGQTVITPNQIGSTYVNPVNVLDQHEARIFDRGRGCCGGGNVQFGYAENGCGC